MKSQKRLVAERVLASRLLAVAAAEFHEHGCNDMDPKLLQGISVTQRAALLMNFNEWYMTTFHVPVPSLEFHEVGDDEWMEYLAWKFSGKPLTPQY